MPDSALGTGYIAESKISAITEFTFGRLGLGVDEENMVVK